MYTSGPGEAALGASRLLNTPILGVARAGQVISIIGGEGIHRYGNAAFRGVQRLAAGVSHLCQGVRLFWAHLSFLLCSFLIFLSLFSVILSLFQSFYRTLFLTYLCGNLLLSKC